nr:MAG TPA: regulatory protein [Caudoviricetes sp.]
MSNQLINVSPVETIDSREVAEMVGIQHKDLLKKVRNYEGILTSAKLRPLDFFIPNEYKDGKGEIRNCYLLTKKGCEMVANKLTGEKGVIFTAKYVNRFEEMEKHIKQQTPTLPSNYLEALERLVDEVKMNEQLVLENRQLRFKLEGKEVKQVEDERLYTVDEIARANRMTARELNKFLNVMGVQYTRKGRWYLYSKYSKKGFTQGSASWLRWTEKGKNFIEELLSKY